MADIDVSSSRCPGYVVVALHGDFDTCDVMRLTRALSAAAAIGAQIVVDLEGLAFIDCSGLSAIVSARNQARQAGGDLLLAAPQQLVLRLLSLIDLTGVLPVFANVDRQPTVTGGPRRRSGWLVNRREVPGNGDVDSVAADNASPAGVR